VDMGFSAMISQEFSGPVMSRSIEICSIESKG
jgi:hypothetical protein